MALASKSWSCARRTWYWWWPGTGQATHDLLGRGATVHAVEIGPAIAAKLREALPSPALTVTVGDFEQIDVGEDRFDALFSATAATK